jgi:DNA-binding FadR family transcriptional regulator
MTHDRVFTDEFKLTHEFLGMMLGVSRPQVRLVTKQLERAGLIAYHRGQVTVIDRKGLEAEACVLPFDVLLAPEVREYGAGGPLAQW